MPARPRALGRRGEAERETGDGTWIAPPYPMSCKCLRRDLLIDFLVPASVASRYRARLVSLEALEAEVAFRYCPSVFRSGVLHSCPASLSLAAGPVIVRLSGILRVERGSSEVRGRLRFGSPAAPGDLDLLIRLCGLDLPSPAPAAHEDSRAEPPHGDPSADRAPLWLRAIGG